MKLFIFTEGAACSLSSNWFAHEIGGHSRQDDSKYCAFFLLSDRINSLHRIGRSSNVTHGYFEAGGLHFNGFVTRMLTSKPFSGEGVPLNCGRVTILQ